MMVDDPVKSPAHYCDGGIETKDYIRSKLTKAEFIGWCKGNSPAVYTAGLNLFNRPRLGRDDSAAD